MISLFMTKFFLKKYMDKEPKLIFIFTPPNSGSTMLAHILNSSEKTLILNPKSEGQWLVDELSGPGRWEEKKKVDWNKVKNIWFEKFFIQKEINSKIEFIIEKSPPNIIRYKDILRTFKSYKIITFIRDPFATCASMTSRMTSNRTIKVNRIDLIKANIERWILINKHINKIKNRYETLSLTYEKMCDETDQTYKDIINFIPEISDINPYKKYKVKDYSPNNLFNFNKKQIGFLSNYEKVVIKNMLDKYMN